MPYFVLHHKHIIWFPKTDDLDKRNDLGLNLKTSTPLFVSDEEKDLDLKESVREHIV